jgi:hypothetical protein
MQVYKVKEKTAIVPPVSKLSGHPDFNSRCVYIKYVIGWENLLKAVVRMNTENIMKTKDNIYYQP